MLKFWINRLFPLLLLFALICVNEVKADDDDDEEKACEFHCLDGKQCVSYEWLCDAEHDCNDHSDELHCLHESECDYEQFACSNDECIEKYERCNGIQDCTNGLDEMNCYEETTTKNPLKWHFTDCQRLDATLVFVAANSSFYCVQIVNDEIKTPGRCFNFSTRRDPITSMDSDMLVRTIYTTKKFPNQIQELSLGDIPVRPKIVVKHQVARFEHIVVDRLTGNIYFTENGNGIGVCNRNNTCSIIVHAHSDQHFKDLRLHPKRGAMFWIDWDEEKGHGESIKVASMDGKESKQLYAFNGIYAISLDEDKEFMFLATENSVMKLSLQTLKSEIYGPVKASAIHYFNCQLFFIDRQRRALFAYDKEDGTREIGDGYQNLIPFLAVENLSFAKGQHNPCTDMNCKDLCVLAEGTHGPDARCIMGETMPLPDQSIDGSEGTGLSVGWIIALFVMIFGIFIIVFGVILYFGVLPKVNYRLGIPPRKNIRASNDINVMYNRKSEFVST